MNGRTELTVSASGLVSALATAKPGTVITVPVAGDPIAFSTSRYVPGYGVCVLLPADQQICVTINNPGGGFHFFGGRFSADEVLGGSSSTNNGVRIPTGGGPISVHGASFDRNQNAVQGSSVQDLWLRKIRMDLNRADNITLHSSKRVHIEESEAGPGARGQKICYFPDGRPPQHSISQASCTAQGGTWEDTAHNDGFQGRNECTDVLIEDSVFGAYAAQGIVSFGTGAEGDLIGRVALRRNRVENAGAWGLFLDGYDLEVVDNTVLLAPDSDSAPIRVVRRGEGRVRGGRNVGPSVQSPTGVDLTAAVVNGDEGVVEPEKPRIVLPPWAPSVPTPPIPPQAAPQHTSGGGIRYVGTLSAGTWLTLNRGQWSNPEGISFEYRWLVDDAVVPGATSQVFQAVAGTVSVECRATNSLGTGDWYKFDPVVVPT